MNKFKDILTESYTRSVGFKQATKFIESLYDQLDKNSNLMKKLVDEGMASKEEADELQKSIQKIEEIWDEIRFKVDHQ